MQLPILAAIIAMAAAAPSAKPAGDSFSITDTTDNDTKERSVRAVQLSQEWRTNLTMLHLDCVDRELKLRLHYYDMQVADQMAVEVVVDQLMDFERAVFVKDEVLGDLAYDGDPRSLLRDVRDHHTVAFTIFTPTRRRTATFKMQGLAGAMARMNQACPRR